MADERLSTDGGGTFPATRWSAIEGARSSDREERRRALDRIASVYWRPVYKYVRTRWGRSADDAQDLTQEFFASLIDRGTLDAYDPRRARLRTFLRSCVDALVTNVDRDARRLKRGGGAALLSLEFELAEGELARTGVVSPDGVDELFEKEWIRSLFATAVEQLRSACAARGKEVPFAIFARYDLEEPDTGRPTYAELAQEFGIATTAVTNHLAFARREFRRIVLDVLRETTTTEDEFRREARILARLEHPGIAPVHDVGRLPDGRVFYAMKYVEGPRLDAYAASSATLPERLRLFQRIAEAVAFAHDRGVLHRDLKPENVMVGPFGEVLVMDWGLAKLLDAPSESGPNVAAEAARSFSADAPQHTAHGTVLGTPGYMSPEQARGDVASLDERSDVYALGAVLFFLLARRAPPTIGPLSQATEVPRPLLAVCAKALAAAPADRYGDALALSADVGRYLDGRRVDAYPEGLLQRGARLYARHRIAFWLVVAYLVVRGSILFFTRR